LPGSHRPSAAERQAGTIGRMHGADSSTICRPTRSGGGTEKQSGETEQPW